MSASVPPLRVLVAGGGVAAIETVLALRALASERVAIELLAPADEYVEKPLSVRSPFDGAAEPRVPLAALPACGIVHHHGARGGRCRAARGAHHRRRAARL
ncbi:hypothetical protein OM076_32355 [Solirubrobacter ginsenosidimutans]|uniref:FAD/NAD(P)-binding domain-containing protein n=1 Tax=Solirubrobacter ginsenosidimutans TaxID=490573 RepID=A0A9X3MXV4_9ACTN|nr:hypothetical protein [Solirubrobacter ginsenosidimutans]MDA0165006.1 hypothetical protein [Solirubrobacter ginsenosidimutans]